MKQLTVSAEALQILREVSVKDGYVPKFKAVACKGRPGYYDTEVGEDVFDHLNANRFASELISDVIIRIGRAYLGKKLQ